MGASSVRGECRFLANRFDHQSGNFFLGFDKISNHSMGAFNEVERLLRGILQHRPQGLIFVFKGHPDAFGNASHDLARNLDRSRIAKR